MDFEVSGVDDYTILYLNFKCFKFPAYFAYTSNAKVLIFPSLILPTILVFTPYFLARIQLKTVRLIYARYCRVLGLKIAIILSLFIDCTSAAWTN